MVKNLETIRILITLGMGQNHNGSCYQVPSRKGEYFTKRITQTNTKLTGRLIGKLEAAEVHRGGMFIFTELTES
jgi:hypothetical protein